jgi:methenyltetrahydrofolate cyclohydrolase
MSIASMTVAECLSKIGEKSPAPGGGAVSSLVAALGAALTQMVVAYSVGKKALADHEPELKAAILELERARAGFLTLADEDAKAYGVVNQLMKLPESDPARAGLAQAIQLSAQVPLNVLNACVELAALCDRLSTRSNRQLRSDLAIAAVLAEAAARSSRWNILVNAGMIQDIPAREALIVRADAIVLRCRQLAGQVEAACLA